MPPRRLLLGTLSAASLAVLVALSLPSCGLEDGYSDGYVGSNCPPGTSDYCCPCPIPEACLDELGYPVRKPIPWECPNACSDLNPDPPPRCFDGGVDGSADGATSALCPSGTCAPKSPQSWEGPVALYYGPQFQAPPCPETAPTLLFEGRPEPDPVPCESCSCDPPVGACLPPTTWTVGASACYGGGVNTNFDAPPNWDGSCTTNVSIQQGQTCGAELCVQSLVVDPPMIVEQPCTPHGNGDPMPEPAKLTAGDPFGPFGRACTGDPWPPCGQESVCVSAPPSFLTCVARSGDEPCPAGWPVKHLLYNEVDDQRTCTECTCSAPSGGSCTVFIGLHEDSTCATLRGSNIVTTGEGPKCMDLLHGTGLAAKSASVLTYERGACTPEGGQAEGDLVLGDARTFCCLEAPSI